jgi:protein TonB
MFGTLLESRPGVGRRRGRAGVTASVVAHVVIIGAVAVATARATVPPPAPVPTHPIIWITHPAIDPQPAGSQGAPGAPDAPQPVQLPTSVPDPGTSIDVPSPNATPASGTTCWTACDTLAIPGAPSSGGRPSDAYFSHQVEKTVMVAPGSPRPRYPDLLRQAGLEGEVLAQFVVDTTGRVRPGSFVSLRATHELFALAVRASLPEMRFFPAEVGGRRVPQLVQQVFSFSVQP